MKKRIRTFDPPDTPMVIKNDSSAPKSLELSEGQFEAHFRRLHLAHMRRIYKEVAVRAEKESWSYRDFLALLLAEEVGRRKQTRLQRCTRNAHFPFFKTIEEFDFALQPTLRESVIGSYLGLDFVTEGRSLILHGKTGRGKTHLAVAIGYRAIQNGFEALFTTAAELIEDLSNASRKGHLQESLETYTHPHVLVIDEVGYLTYGPDAANVLFHVVNNRHLRKRPMIFTTNKPLTEWGKVLHDEDMAAAILDRVLERGRFIHLDGPSGRTRHLNLDEILPAGTDRARISGIGVPEFPEPTYGRAGLYWQVVMVALSMYLLELRRVFPGEAIGVLAFVAVIVAFRAERNRGEQVGWIMIAFFLFVVEIRSIYRDRNEFAENQAAITRTEDAHHEQQMSQMQQIAQTQTSLTQVIQEQRSYSNRTVIAAAGHQNVSPAPSPEETRDLRARSLALAEKMLKSRASSRV
jgi:DNA replication protein DnaC